MTVITGDQEARALEELGLQELREVWRKHFGRTWPQHRSADLLRRLLAWRIQAKAQGGLDRAARRAVLGSGPVRAPGPVLSPGVRLTREWKGRLCDVEVIADGFLFEGQRYDSLSEVAREITGSRWNGPRFFGLRKGAGQ